MSDLTELWKKGELDIDECYFAETEGGIYKATGEYLNSSSCINGFDITSILEPVPSYEKWQAKLEENAQLKELLKEIRSKIKTVYDFDTREFTNCAEYDNDLLTKLDEDLK